MLIRLTSPTCRIGASIIQYFPKQGWVYFLGEIIKVSDTDIVADFGDMVVRFPLTDIFYAIDTDICEEHYTTLSGGTVEQDYRKPAKDIIDTCEAELVQ